MHLLHDEARRDGTRLSLCKCRSTATSYIAHTLAYPSRPPLTMYLSINLSLSAGFV